MSNLKTFLANASRNGCLRRSLDISKCLADCAYDLIFMHFDPNDERMHHYQRGRASITGFTVELREIIETGRLVVVVMTRLVLHSVLSAIVRVIRLVCQQ